MNREIELKLECEPDALEQVQHSPALSELQHGRSRKRLLRSIYFDTEDFSLLQNGLALRLRDSGGKRIQTLKTARKNGSPESDRHEYETLLPPSAESPDLNQLPSSLRNQIRKLAGKSPILPRLRTDIERIASELRTREGDKIELALDRGTLSANGSKEPISEVELELKQGDPASLYRIALKLVESVPLRVKLASKSEQGLALARGKSRAIVKADTPRLERNMRAEEAYALILRQCLMHLLANEEAMRVQRSPEALHQMRVALRRLLSAFAVFKRLSRNEEAAGLRRDVKWLASSLGHARDLDVLVNLLQQHQHKAGADGEKLRHAVEGLRKRAWGRAVKDISAPRYTQFVLRLALYIAAQNKPAAKETRALPQFAERALDRVFARVTELGDRIDRLDTEERHTMRKRLKKLRYSLGFFSALHEAEDVKTYLQGLSQMQDLFGGLNDAAVAHATLRGLTQRNAGLRDAAEAMARLLDKRADRDWRAARQAWRKFRLNKPVWR